MPRTKKPAVEGAPTDPKASGISIDLSPEVVAEVSEYAGKQSVLGVKAVKDIVRAKAEAAANDAIRGQVAELVKAHVLAQLG